MTQFFKPTEYDPDSVIDSAYRLSPFLVRQARGISPGCESTAHTLAQAVTELRTRLEAAQAEADRYRAAYAEMYPERAPDFQGDGHVRVAVDYDRVAHGPACARRGHGAAECTCPKADFAGDRLEPSLARYDELARLGMVSALIGEARPATGPWLKENGFVYRRDGWMRADPDHGTSLHVSLVTGWPEVSLRDHDGRPTRLYQFCRRPGRGFPRRTALALLEILEIGVTSDG